MQGINCKPAIYNIKNSLLYKYGPLEDGPISSCSLQISLKIQIICVYIMFLLIFQFRLSGYDDNINTYFSIAIRG